VKKRLEDLSQGIGIVLLTIQARQRGNIGILVTMAAIGKPLTICQWQQRFVRCSTPTPQGRLPWHSSPEK
jgi:hypothetical protein